jgi:hypothetical protein
MLSFIISPVPRGVADSDALCYSFNVSTGRWTEGLITTKDPSFVVIALPFFIVAFPQSMVILPRSILALLLLAPHLLPLPGL